MKNGSCADPTLLAAHGAEVRLKTDAEREVRGQKIPSVPTQVEVDNHNLTHEPFKDWCEVCTMYRARQTSMLVQIIHIQVTAFFCPSPLPFGGSTVLSLTRDPGEANHLRQSVSDTRVPRYQLHHEDNYSHSGHSVLYYDFGYCSRMPGGADKLTCLVLKDRDTQLVHVVPTLQKGGKSLEYLVTEFVRFMMHTGHCELSLRSDLKPSNLVMLDAVQRFGHYSPSCTSACWFT